jgi:hypothetical protein
MEKRYETIVDESGIEIYVAFAVWEEANFTEEGHGFHQIEGGNYVDLISVELIIARRSIELMPMLNEKQQESIINQLSIF